MFLFQLRLLRQNLGMRELAQGLNFSRETNCWGRSYGGWQDPVVHLFSLHPTLHQHRGAQHMSRESPRQATDVRCKEEGISGSGFREEGIKESLQHSMATLPSWMSYNPPMCCFQYKEYANIALLSLIYPYIPLYSPIQHYKNTWRQRDARFQLVAPRK